MSTLFFFSMYTDPEAQVRFIKAVTELCANYRWRVAPQLKDVLFLPSITI